MESLVWLAIPGLVMVWLFLPRKAKEKPNSGSKKVPDLRRGSVWH